MRRAPRNKRALKTRQPTLSQAAVQKFVNPPTLLHSRRTLQVRIFKTHLHAAAWPVLSCYSATQLL